MSKEEKSREGFEERERIKREELESFLKSMADEIKRKANADFFDVEIEYKKKRKHGREKAKFEIEIKWESGGSVQSGSEKSESEFSRVKKEMKVIQKSFIPMFESGEITEENMSNEFAEKVNRLVELNSAFAAYSKGKAWENELDLFTEKLLELKSAAEEKDFEKAKALAYEINSLKKACHRKYIKD